MLLFPILDLGCFYLAVGRNPANLPIGIVNNEVDQWHNCYSQNLITVTNYNETCNFHQISCRFIHELDRTNDLKAVSVIIEMILIQFNLLTINTIADVVSNCRYFIIISRMLIVMPVKPKSGVTFILPPISPNHCNRTSKVVNTSMTMIWTMPK